jgi:outer membrane protein assembly factor BamB
MATLGLLALGACERPSNARPATSATATTEATPAPAEFGTVEAVDPLKHPGPAREQNWTEPARVPDCHELFEPLGEPTSVFPLQKGEVRTTSLVGCGLEAHHVAEDGREWVAYARPRKSATRTTDLRIVAFDADGKRRWHRLMDRSSQGNHFVANYRRSWFAEVPPYLVCAGTLWEGTTQGTCIRDESGEPVWDGFMRFWAGSTPIGRNKSLYVADISGLTRRYPFSGVEMRHRRLDGSGGRGALYLNDQTHLFFSPARADSPRLVRYAFDGMDIDWSVPLPGQPSPTYGAVFREQKLAVLRMDNTIWGVDTETGRGLWALLVEEDRPSLVMHGDDLVMLRRKMDGAVTVFGLDPRDGSRRWHAAAPEGATELIAKDGLLFARSVRAVRRLLP